MSLEASSLQPPVIFLPTRLYLLEGWGPFLNTFVQQMYPELYVQLLDAELSDVVKYSLTDEKVIL